MSALHRLRDGVAEWSGLIALVVAIVSCLGGYAWLDDRFDGLELAQNQAVICRDSHNEALWKSAELYRRQLKPATLRRQLEALRAVANRSCAKPAAMAARPGALLMLDITRTAVRPDTRRYWRAHVDALDESDTIVLSGDLDHLDAELRAAIPDSYAQKTTLISEALKSYKAANVQHTVEAVAINIDEGG